VAGNNFVNLLTPLKGVLKRVPFIGVRKVISDTQLKSSIFIEVDDLLTTGKKTEPVFFPDDIISGGYDI